MFVLHRPAIVILSTLIQLSTFLSEAKLLDGQEPLSVSGGTHQYYSSPPFTYSPYYKGPVCTPNGPIRYPTSENEVIQIVRKAILSKVTCKAVGALHSATDIVCTDGIAIDMKGIQGVRLNSDYTVSVGAGVNIRDLGDYLVTHGRALGGIPGFGNLTVGGVIGTGAHGSSIKYTSSISEVVVSLRIVDGFGQLRTIVAEEDLLAFRVHLGLLGIILEVTFRTEPLFKFRGYNYVVSDEILTNGQAIRMAEETDRLSLYWFPSMRRVVVANWTRVDPRTPGNADTNDHVPSTSTSFSFYSTRLLELAQRYNSLPSLNLVQGYTFPTLYRTVPDYFPIYTENGFSVKNPAVGYFHRMVAPSCSSTGWKQCPWFHGANGLTMLDNEFAVDLSKLGDLVRTVRDIISKSPAVFPLQGILMRFSEASKTYMALTRGQRSVYFEFYVKKRKNYYDDASLGLAAYQAILQSVVLKYGGRSHWGKSGAYYNGIEALELKLDQTARQSFLNKMKEFDPNGIFLNDFGRRLKGVGTKITMDPQTKHCALLDNCICQKNDDCAKNQKCSSIEGYPYFPVCLSPPNPEEDNFIDPNPLSVPGIFNYVKYVVRALSRQSSRPGSSFPNGH